MDFQRIIAINKVVERLPNGGPAARRFAASFVTAQNELTNVKGPYKCIDTVPSATSSLASVYDRIKQPVMLDRPWPDGIFSILGVYGGLFDKIPSGAPMDTESRCLRGTDVHNFTDPGGSTS